MYCATKNLYTCKANLISASDLYEINGFVLAPFKPESRTDFVEKTDYGQLEKGRVIRHWILAMGTRREVEHLFSEKLLRMPTRKSLPVEPQKESSFSMKGEPTKKDMAETAKAQKVKVQQSAESRILNKGIKNKEEKDDNEMNGKNPKGKQEGSKPDEKKTTKKNPTKDLKDEEKNEKNPNGKDGKSDEKKTIKKNPIKDHSKDEKKKEKNTNGKDGKPDEKKVNEMIPTSQGEKEEHKNEKNTNGKDGKPDEKRVNEMNPTSQSEKEKHKNEKACAQCSSLKEVILEIKKDVELIKDAVLSLKERKVSRERTQREAHHGTIENQIAFDVNSTAALKTAKKFPSEIPSGQLWCGQDIFISSKRADKTLLESNGLQAAVTGITSIMFPGKVHLFGLKPKPNSSKVRLADCFISSIHGIINDYNSRQGGSINLKESDVRAKLRHTLSNCKAPGDMEKVKGADKKTEDESTENGAESVENDITEQGNGGNARISRNGRSSGSKSEDESGEDGSDADNGGSGSETDVDGTFQGADGTDSDQISGHHEEVEEFEKPQSFDIFDATTEQHASVNRHIRRRRN